MNIKLLDREIKKAQRQYALLVSKIRQVESRIQQLFNKRYNR